MMLTMHPGRYTSFRVWIGELPNAEFSSSRRLTRIVPAANGPRRDSRVAAVEVSRCVGPRYIYGLIGGTWMPDQIGEVALQVSLAEQGPVFQDSLVSRMDEVRIGLPAEYGRGVLEGIDMALLEPGAVHAGGLQIHCAAHGIVSSSHNMFSHLTAILLKICSLPDETLGEDDLMKCFPQNFW